MLDSYLTTVRPTVLRDQVANAIRSAIASGALQPGQRLVEMELASRTGVSKAPVREALRLLESEGLVTTIPHRGSFVTRLSATDVLELFGVRAAVERLAVGLLVDGISSETVSQLEEAVAAMGRAEEEGDAGRLKDEDIRFHRLIVDNSGSGRARAVWLELQGLIRLILAHKEIREPGSSVVTDRHRKILEAIRLRERDTAQRLVEQHLLDAGREISRRVELPNPLPPSSPLR